MFPCCTNGPAFPVGHHDVNTPAHLILGSALLARRGEWKVNTAAVVGSLAPDVSLYLLAAHALFIQHQPSSIVFDQMYFSEAWQKIFAVDNSFFVWLVLLAIAGLARLRWLGIFAIAGLLHLATDFPLHHDDGRPHFWPLSDWIFASPVSYWDPAHYRTIVGMLESGLCLVLCIPLFRRFHGWPARSAIVLAALAVTAPNLVWHLAGF